MAAPDAAWLVSRRWFRAKHRPIERIVVADGASVDTRTELRIVEVTYGDGGPSDCYLVPTVEAREPEDEEGAWRAIVGAMAAGAHLRAARGRFAATHTDALEALAGPPLTERRLGVEQSNTSVRIGDRLILKLYRLLEPGLNPDLEIGVFLADVGFEDTPALAGSMTWEPDDGEPAAAAMLQAFVPSTGDAWAAMLDAIAADAVRSFELARRLGELTRRLHRALASRPSAEFPARPTTVEESSRWRASAERQLAQAVAAVSGEAHARMVALGPAVRARFADAFGAASGYARVTRIHGDLHLGQVLARTDGGFSVIDFEGEPARPLAERRAPSSPVRDVAGMLRSLDYAARTAGRNWRGFDADGWLVEARAAFLAGYGDIGPEDGPLLDAFELEKACYEVRYEAGNRPDWVWLPLAAIERLAAAA